MTVPFFSIARLSLNGSLVSDTDPVIFCGGHAAQSHSAIAVQLCLPIHDGGAA